MNLLSNQPLKTVVARAAGNSNLPPAINMSATSTFVSHFTYTTTTTTLYNWQRIVPAMGRFDHTNGAGHVARHLGDYRDAILNRKAVVHLLVHENLGGMSPYAAFIPQLRLP